ncbi:MULTISPECIES: hypothetical protein [unclassified Arcicella]|uniref:hypothetical protein n=1 Tax=unclassified Arcicella TaxID=2644986 RepID=UPI00286114D2|nr:MULTISPECIES: hypothetical protein [unclassified Arcicella]MDR6560031.1 hypothetical protein [Arcicella sp. BE51]MDR6810362.1 hypothetical protein [Arcicella sp. BE140]MDR6821712.1 hypothetical protein [Arcicella sp. BE139]
MIFEFISDKNFKELLERDFQELETCLSVKATKSVLVLSGSIIEALLIEYFLQFLPTAYTREKIFKLTFQELLDLSEKEILLTPREKNLAWVIKDYRNLIHPGKEIRKDEKFDFESAQISFSLVKIIVNAIRNKYSSSYGYTAKEVIDKLKNDWSFRTVYGKVILKLNNTERINLFHKLIENEFYEKKYWDCFLLEDIIPQRTSNTNLEYTKPFLLELKPLVSIDLIKENLKQLLKEVETGDSVKAFSLYNLFHEELNFLTKDEIESIVIYIFSMFNDVLEKCSDLVEEKTYSTIGKYIETEKTQLALKNFAVFCMVHFDNKDGFSKEMDLFEQVFNSLNQTDKEFLQKEMTAFLSPFDKLPPNMVSGFLQPAIQRKIISVSK